MARGHRRSEDAVAFTNRLFPAIQFSCLSADLRTVDCPGQAGHDEIQIHDTLIPLDEFSVRPGRRGSWLAANAYIRTRIAGPNTT